MVTLTTILGITNYSLIFIAIGIYIFILIKIKRARQNRQDVPILLLCNTCIAVLVTLIVSFVMIISSLTNGFLTYNLSFCQIWGFLYDIFEGSIYYSYCLQAFYRLCRIVFYQKRFLINFSLYIKIIIVQWLFVFCLTLPALFLYYVQLPTEQYCLVSHSDIHGSMYLIFTLYFIPLISIVLMYLWITSFMRQTSQAATAIIPAQQRQRNIRDLTIIRRLLVLILLLSILRFPTIIFIIHDLIIDELFSWAYTVVSLVTSICLIMVGFITTRNTPQLRSNRFDVIHVHPNQIGILRAA